MRMEVKGKYKTIANHGLLALVWGIILAGLLTFAVHALSNRSPDSADFATNSAYYTLSNTRDVDGSTTMGVAVYRAGARPTSRVRVVVTYQSGALQGGNQNNQGEGFVQFSIDGGPYTVQHGGANGSSNLYIQPSDWHAVTGGYEVHIGGRLNPSTRSGDDSNHINFKFTVDNGYILGEDGGYRFAVLQDQYCVNGSGDSCAPYHTYSIPFAPNCGVNYPVQSIIIHDMDDGSNLIQPRHLRVQIVDTTTGTVVNNDSWTGGETRSGDDAIFKFNPATNHKYRLVLTPVNANNVLQFTLPPNFDSVNYEFDCSLRATNWKLQSTATSNKTTVLPGQTVRFTFNTKNLGPDRTSNFTYNDSFQYFRGATAAAVTHWPSPNATVALNAGASTSSYDTVDVTIPANTNETKLCAWRATSVTSSSNSADAKSNTRCVTIAQPACSSLTTSPGAIEPDEKYGVSTKVAMGSQANAVAAMAGSNYYVRITGPEDADGNDGPSVYNNANVTNTGDTSLVIDASGGITGSVRNLGPAPGPGTYDVYWGITGGIAPQDCHSTFDITYLPYFGVRSGDIAAGAGFASASGTCTQDNTADITSWNYDNDAAGNHTGYYGAGSQAAVYALGHIKSFASGTNPLANTSSTAGRNLNGALQFTNPYDMAFASSGVPVNGTGTYGGSFGSLPCMNDFADSITGGSSSWTGNFGTSGTYNLTAGGGTFVLDGGELSPGVVINIKVTGNIFIRGDITYDDSGGAGDYPRLNLVSSGGNIYIGDGVRELHGLYVAQNAGGSGGTISTCATLNGNDMTETTDYDTCNFTLQIFGAVAAKSLNLNRSYGTLTSDSGPAEEFIYSPELWLAMPDCLANPGDAVCGNSLTPTYDAVTGLPPVL